MIYKKNYMKVISRMKDLYGGLGVDHIYAKMNIPNPVLEFFANTFDDGPVNQPDVKERSIFWDEVLSIYSNLEDDSIPSCYLSEFDQGLYAGLLGGKVKYLRHAASGWISSMVEPFINDIKEINNFYFDENCTIYKNYINQMEIFKKQGQGKFGISHFICLDGVNFMFELRGATQTYYDLIDYPDEAKKIIDFSTKLCIKVQDDFFKTIGLLQGGTVSNVSQWLPGKIVSESVDAFHLTSSQMFEEWGLDVVKTLFNHFNGGVIHLHTNGHHLINSISKIRGLKCIVFLDENFAEPCYKKLDELSRLCGRIPMVISIPFEEFVNKLESKELPKNILYDVLKVPDIKTANEIMKKVQSYS